MICKFCGNVIEDNSDFCFICGQKLPKEYVEANATVESNDIFSQADEFAEETAPADEAIEIEEVEIDTVEETEEVVEAEIPETEEIAVPEENNVTAPASPDAPVYDSTAPIYAQSTPIYAQTAPVYAQQVIIQHVQAPTVTKAKKEKKVADPSVASTASKIFAAIFSATFILQFISWIWYNKAEKAGHEKKATDLLNATMIGLCIFAGIVCLFLIKSFMM